MSVGEINPTKSQMATCEACLISKTLKAASVPTASTAIPCMDDIDKAALLSLQTFPGRVE